MARRNFKKLLPVLAIAFALSFQSCIKDYFEFDKIAGVEWNPSLAIPLAYATIGVEDIITNLNDSTFVQVDPETGLITLHFIGGEHVFYAAEYLQLYNRNLPYANYLDASAASELSTTGSYTHTDNFVQDYNTHPGMKLDSMLLKEGILNFNLSSTVQHDVTCHVTFPTIRQQNGNAFSFTVNAPYNGSPANIDRNYDLKLHSMHLPNNEIPIDIVIIYTYKGNPVQLGQGVNLNFGLNDFQYRHVYGNFETRNLTFPEDTIEIFKDDNRSYGNFHLEDPKFTFEIDNSFGVPFNLEFEDVNIYNYETSLREPVSFLGLPNPAQVFPSQTPGSTSKQTFFINNTNSNIHNLIKGNTKFVLSNVNLVANPNGGQNNNFMSDDSKIHFKPKVELPLHGYTYEFEINDSITIDFNEEVKNINSVLIRFAFQNEMPAGVKLSALFLDEDRNELMRLLDQDNFFIAPSPIDGNGHSSGSTKKITDLEIPKEQIDLLEKTRYIVLQGEAETVNARQSQIIKFFNINKLHVKISMQVNASFNPN